MSDAQVIMVKFQRASQGSRRKKELAKWIGESLVTAEPLFPDDEDAELSTLYALLVRGDQDAARIIELLQEQEDVEYAHVPGERRPAKE